MSKDKPAAPAIGDHLLTLKEASVVLRLSTRTVPDALDTCQRLRTRAKPAVQSAPSVLAPFDSCGPRDSRKYFLEQCVRFFVRLGQTHCSRLHPSTAVQSTSLPGSLPT